VNVIANGRGNISHIDTKITKNDTKKRELCAFLRVLCAFVADVDAGNCR